MKRLTFKEYHESRQQLIEASEVNRKSNLEYSVTKYCKIPIVLESTLEKEYIPFKPKDKIRILWEYESEIPTLKRFTLIYGEDEKELTPVWSSNKIFEWSNTNCKPEI